jgi:hypothetical protein
MRHHSNFSGSKLLKGSLRFHFTAPLVIFAGLLGACAIPITFITGTNVNEIPAHMPLVATLVYSIAGIISGSLLTFHILKWMSRDLSHPLPIWIWLVVGLVFGGLLSIFTGALLPIMGPILGLVIGDLTVDQIPKALLYSLSRMPLNSLIHGSLGMFTSFQAGILLMVGGVLVNYSVAKQKTFLSDYMPWIIIIALGIPVLILAFWGDPDFLFKVGRLGER